MECPGPVAVARAHLLTDRSQPEAAGQQLAGEPLPLRQRLLCSDYRRWVHPGVLTLTATKRLLDTVTCAGPIGGCARYCARKASATLLAPGHRLLPHHQNWRLRPVADSSARRKLQVNIPRWAGAALDTASQ